MTELKCVCGHKESDADHYKTEAKMWVHAIQDHLDDLKKMTADQIAGWLKDSDQKMGVK